MAKKKQDRVPIIKNPKIGTKYQFKFAGSKMYGTLIRKGDSLTKTYGYPYFWFNSDEDRPNDDGKLMGYPVSIYDILSRDKNV